MLQFDAIRNTPVQTAPFPHAIVEDCFEPDKKKALVTDFPAIRHPGSIPVENADYGKAFRELLDDLESDRFRDLIAGKLELDLEGSPIMTTVRGVMRASRDGSVHTDSTSKRVTVLIYFNPEWTQEGGRLRLLNNKQDFDDYVAEVPPLLGRMVIFKVTPNGWHGHKPVDGKRLSLQMNYMASAKALGKHNLLHRVSAGWKNLTQRS